MPYVSIVVPVLNEEDILERTLKSIRAQVFRDYELIVVDNGSTDASPQIATKYADKLLFEENKGYIYAVHRGILEAKGEIVTACDADTVYPSGWLAKMVGCFKRDERVVAVYGPMGFNDTKRFISLCAVTGYVVADFLSRPFGVRISGGANLGFRRDAYLELGGYMIESKIASQDFILVRKLVKVGKVKFVPSLIVYTSARRFRRHGFLRGLARAVKFWSDVAFNRYSVTYDAYFDKDYYKEKGSNR